jgi:hypothetical protein
MSDPILYREIVTVHVNNEWTEGPSLAVIELNKKQIKRIRQLASAVKRLKVVYIEDWDSPKALKKSEYEEPKDNGIETKVTDETTQEEAALLINDENPFVFVLAKHRLAGHSVTSHETLSDLSLTLPNWDGSSECDILQVSGDDFHYHGIIKHTDVTWSTEGIPIKDLTECLLSTLPDIT